MNAAAEILIHAVKSGALLLFRSDEERIFLESWLKGETGAGSSPVSPHTAAVDGTPIKERIRQCNRCAGVSERKYSFGTGENGVMIILHMPSKITSMEKKVFRAESLELMRKMMKGIGITLDQCYITNMVKCESGAVNQPSAMFLQCEELLHDEIDLITPSVIIVMGSMGPMAKLCRAFTGISWFTIEHPVTLIKNPDLKRAAWETLKVIREKLGIPA